MSIGVEEYRKQVEFDEPNTSSDDRAKFLLFFVTKLARLRDDMTPAVIADRLSDWGYPGITVEEIIQAFDRDSDVVSSKARGGAYAITQVAERRIKKEFKSFKARTWRTTLFQSAIIVVAISLIAMLALIGYNLATNNVTVRDFSFPEFRRRVGFDEATTLPSDRAKYFLYFITQVVQLRNDMIPDVIEVRLVDIGYNDITAAEIEQAFLSDSDVRVSNQRQDAFQINPVAYERFEIMLDIEIPPTEILTLQWLWRHIPFKGWLSLLTGLAGLISSSFTLGYWIAMHSPNRKS